jgi:tungstate transport system substrate-binding protein
MNTKHRLHRRQLLMCTALLGMGMGVAMAAQLQSLRDPMRLGVDQALMQSGLARALEVGFESDTGIALKLTAGTALAMLEATELGEQDVVLSNAPWLETQMEKQGLLHDRRPIAMTSLVLVGPAAIAKPLDARRDIVLALQRLAEVSSRFLSATSGSGTQLAELSLWRAAGVVPDPSWYQTVADPVAALPQAMAMQACLFLELGTWLAQRNTRGYGILVQDDPRMLLPVHAMRSFRVNHPAAKLFFNWMTGPKGQHLVSRLRGYRRAS